MHGWKNVVGILKSHTSRKKFILYQKFRFLIWATKVYQVKFQISRHDALNATRQLNNGNDTFNCILVCVLRVRNFTFGCNTQNPLSCLSGWRWRGRRKFKFCAWMAGWRCVREHHGRQAVIVVIVIVSIAIKRTMRQWYDICLPAKRAPTSIIVS